MIISILNSDKTNFYKVRNWLGTGKGQVRVWEGVRGG